MAAHEGAPGGHGDTEDGRRGLRRVTVVNAGVVQFFNLELFCANCVNIQPALFTIKRKSKHAYYFAGKCTP